MIIDPYMFVGTTAGYLDPFWPTSLYSMRKRKSDYAGFCVKVRNTSTNTETNVGFDANGWCDTSTLHSLITGGEGLAVVTWYDQSGSGKDATQATANFQPIMAVGGSLLLFHGHPCMDFPNDGVFLTAASDAVFGFGTAPWTVEVFLHTNGLQTTHFNSVVDFRPSVSTPHACGINSPVPHHISWFNGTSVIGDTGASIVDTTDYSLAWSSPATTGNLLQFVNGNQESSNSTAVDLQATRAMTIGNSSFRTCRISALFGEVAICKGTQKYSGSFTPRSYA